MFLKTLEAQFWNWLGLIVNRNCVSKPNFSTSKTKFMCILVIDESAMIRFNVLLLLNSLVVWKRDFLMLNIWKSVKCNLFGLKRKYKNDVISLQYLMTSRNPRPPLLFNFSIWGHFRYFKQFLAHLLSFDLRSPLCQLMWATRSRLIQIEQIRIYLNKNTESQMRKQVITTQIKPYSVKISLHWPN